MNSFPACLAALRQSLAQRLDRLQAMLHDLRDRLRAAVVQTIGETVAGTVRDTLCLLLGEPPRQRTTYPYSQPWHDDWVEPDDPDDWPGSPSTPDLFADPDDLDDDYAPPVAAAAPASGHRILAWWRQLPARWPALVLASGLALTSVCLRTAAPALPGLLASGFTLLTATLT